MWLSLSQNKHISDPWLIEHNDISMPLLNWVLFCLMALKRTIYTQNYAKIPVSASILLSNFNWIKIQSLNERKPSDNISDQIRAFGLKVTVA